MSGTLRRGTPARGRIPQRRPALKKQREPLIDRILTVLPISEAALRRIVTWVIVASVAGAGLAVASWFGVPTAIGVAVAEGAGRAGFRVAQIEITGLKRMDRMSVYAVALDQQSRAMPLVDLEAVRQKLLRYGWIQDAHVSRRLPDTLLVHIVERQPAAIWQDRGRLTLIDATGVPLEGVRPDAMPELPLVIGRGANVQEANYQALLQNAPALKPLVRAASWIGNRRWDLLFTTGETLMLPEGENESVAALVKFAEMDGADRLLGRGWVRFDMRNDGQMLARSGSGREVAKPVAEDTTAPAQAEEPKTEPTVATPTRTGEG